MPQYQKSFGLFWSGGSYVGDRLALGTITKKSLVELAAVLPRLTVMLGSL